LFESPRIKDPNREHSYRKASEQRDTGSRPWLRQNSRPWHPFSLDAGNAVPAAGGKPVKATGQRALAFQGWMLAKRVRSARSRASNTLVVAEVHAHCTYIILIWICGALEANLHDLRSVPVLFAMEFYRI
jgi:hypothetical protein